MKKHILSVYFGYHDSNITIASPKEVLLVLQAERVFRKKHMRVDRNGMIGLIKSGLEYLNLNIDDLYRLYVARWNNQFGEEKINLLGKYFKPILTGHHQNHIGTGLPSSFKKAVIVCADGGSEDGTTKIYYKNNEKIECVENLDATVMTGKFYGTITQMAINPIFGRAHDTDPGKTMGLSALGKYSKRYHKLIQKYEAEINKLHFNGCNHLLKSFGISKNYSKPWLDNDRKGLAHTAQLYWQNKFFEKLKEHRKYSSNIILTGGCAFNILLNSKLIDSGLYSRVYISPIPGDEGQSLGAILYHHPNIKCQYPYLGRSFGEINRISKELVQSVCRDLLSHKIIAWYEGRSEVGPRALGHRSFLGLPDSPAMRDRLSIRIKKREPYRPVAAMVAEEYLSHFFKTGYPSPYMTFAPKVRPITEKLAPAIVHFDKTCRIQTLKRSDNPTLYQILLEIQKHAGVPILMNSSFNVSGEPIVDTPKEAVKAFKISGADALYINGGRYEKS